MDQFRLMYPVPDSDREAIKNLDGTEMLFNSVAEAKEFRLKNDLTNVNDDAMYWISDSKYEDGKTVLYNSTVEHCWIELAE
jgi:hypothetical protein